MDIIQPGYDSELFAFFRKTFQKGTLVATGLGFIMTGQRHLDLLLGNATAWHLKQGMRMISNHISSP